MPSSEMLKIRLLLSFETLKLTLPSLVYLMAFDKILLRICLILRASDFINVPSSNSLSYMKLRCLFLARGVNISLKSSHSLLTLNSEVIMLSLPWSNLEKFKRFVNKERIWSAELFIDAITRLSSFSDESISISSRLPKIEDRGDLMS